MGDERGKLPVRGGQENNNEKESVNWDEFDFSFLDSDGQSDNTSGYGSSKTDGNSEDVMGMSFPHSPGDLKTVMPEKPSIMEALTNFQSGKINKSLYLDQLKIYADGQIQIFADRVEKTVEAHQNLSQAALDNIREKIKLWGKEIMAATDLSLQKTVSQGVLRASEIANKALTELAGMNAPDIIVKPAMKGVIDQMQKTIANVQHREVGISENGKMEWDRQ
ncbi:hypothetical protein SAMN02746065_12642 [Desulfocicer vacuolatum DSM 3385]|uniref:Uncharacterized protein n=1 Tax=Desulfocicer vacuolatum DSM 3385 TaxID=1121400 RepID=A0A1W2EA69_9BACT|nr:hypothetical protein [Desulfocicer vacuolatum]SMD05948.1 hypothetical protein SAMN02746065_12642 [Desulfocicer vacuolatum DSM 3385]